jgi:hypothetical protein
MKISKTLRNQKILITLNLSKLMKIKESIRLNIKKNHKTLSKIIHIKRKLKKKEITPKFF